MHSHSHKLGLPRSRESGQSSAPRLVGDGVRDPMRPVAPQRAKSTSELYSAGILGSFLCADFSFPKLS